ncbi:transposase family protein [Acrocarpospora corrugata]|uniref:transposase family protein n=1 Tax=Acrocarpospora corrugata TaxID=35763 RepID=UPI003BEEC92D
MNQGREHGLLARFRSISDPRQASKVRHTLEAILAVMTFGTTVVGGDSITAIIEWARDAPQDLLARLGCWRDPLTGVRHPPSERTMRRVLAKVDGNEVDRQTAAYLGESAAPANLERADSGTGAGTGNCDAQHDTALPLVGRLLEPGGDVREDRRSGLGI